MTAHDGLNRSIDVGGCQIGNQHPMVLIGGVNVLESRELALTVAEAFVRYARTSACLTCLRRLLIKRIVLRFIRFVARVAGGLGVTS